MRQRRGSAALIVFILSVRGYISVKVRQAILHAALYGGQKWRRHVASVVYYILHKNAGLWRLSARTFTIELHRLTCSPKNNRSSNQVYQLYLAKTRMKQNKQKHTLIILSSPLKSTSPLPSVSNMSMTRWTSGFCWSSGNDMNSSTLRDPELSRSSFLNRLPSLLISSASTEQREIQRDK